MFCECNDALVYLNILTKSETKLMLACGHCICNSVVSFTWFTIQSGAHVLYFYLFIFSEFEIKERLKILE